MFEDTTYVTLQIVSLRPIWMRARHVLQGSASQLVVTAWNQEHTLRSRHTTDRVHNAPGPLRLSLARYSVCVGQHYGKSWCGWHCSLVSRLTNLVCRELDIIYGAVTLVLHSTKCESIAGQPGSCALIHFVAKAEWSISEYLGERRLYKSPCRVPANAALGSKRTSSYTALLS